jgi:DNA repair exonuclease SbcCD ATPase subunit/DNA repair exonuclease SbcCD nuclease subunit
MHVVKKIDIGLDKIDKIYHIADVHVRNLKRHKEYRIVFNRLYRYIESTKTPNSVIYLAGDIVHSKTDLSPESVDLVSEFFTNCGNLAPTIIITGNHDCNLNNSYRLDALTPIVNAINHPNVFYLKDTGVYEMADCHFNVMSVFDKPVDYIRASDFEGTTKIGLHHGAVHNSTTDMGIRLSNTHVTNDLFIGHDMVLLGDIHKPQFLNDEKTIAYAGSTIQQNHGEALIHGIMVWDVPTRMAEFVPIKNDYGYYTFEVVNGKIVNNSDDVPIKPRVRIKSKDTDASTLKLIITELRQKYDIKELAIQRINNINNSIVQRKINYADYREVEVQNKIITEYLSDNFVIPEKTLDAIRHINRKIHSKLPEAETNRNVTWVPKRFEFSNMFSYGDSNVLDFTNMTGTYGLFAPNASGKSTLLDALSFCCFDKCSRTSKAVHVLNNKKSSFTSKFEFELEGRTYFIERNGIKNNAGHVRVLVNFWYIDEDGNTVSLNEDQRDNTNKAIRKYLGTYDDFILTALSLQNNNTGFIDKSQRERKDLLSQFLDISIFDQQYQIANEDIKETAAAIKEHKRTDYSTELSDAITTINSVSSSLIQIESDKQNLIIIRNTLSDELVRSTKELKPIDSELTDISKLQKDVYHYSSSYSIVSNTIQSLKPEFETAYSASIDARAELNSMIELGIESQIATYETALYQIKDIQAHVDSLNRSLARKKEIASHLETHEYDPDCQYCVSNPIVQNAIAESNTIPDLLTEIAEVESKLTASGSMYTRDQYNELKLNYKSVNDIARDTEKIVADKISVIKQKKLELDELKWRYDTATKLYDKAIAQKETIKHNANISEQIELLQDELADTNNELSEIEDKISHMRSKLMVAEKTKTDVEKSIERLAELEQEYTGYEYYLNAVKRDGVPYDLIEKALPQIEAEVNNILTQIVDFTIMFNTDGKNINAYIVYDTDNFWPLELTSGMEKFISSLAIRSSLINISSLPRPNFIAIDEGFGALDSDNLNSMHMLFDYLKSQFGFILSISHIDAMRDIVDTLIEIKKESGYSKIDTE